MIYSKILFFSLVLLRIKFVYLTKVTDTYIKGYCGKGVVKDLTSYIVDRGHTIEFTSSEQNGYGVSLEFIIKF